jgi:hypothetical protein
MWLSILNVRLNIKHPDWHSQKEGAQDEVIAGEVEFY